MRLIMDALPALLSQAMGNRPIREVARTCGLDNHTLLSDILYGKSRRPKPETLQALAAGLNIPYERLALAAYGIIHEPVLA